MIKIGKMEVTIKIVTESIVFTNVDGPVWLSGTAEITAVHHPFAPNDAPHHWTIECGGWKRFEQNNMYYITNQGARALSVMLGSANKTMLEICMSSECEAIGFAICEALSKEVENYYALQRLK